MKDLLNRLDQILKLDRTDAELAIRGAFPPQVDEKRAAYAKKVVAARKELGLSCEMNSDGILDGWTEAWDEASRSQGGSE